jgi:hypothetical protein
LRERNGEKEKEKRRGKEMEKETKKKPNKINFKIFVGWNSKMNKN